MKSVKQIISSLPIILIDSIKVAFVILGGIEIVFEFYGVLTCYCGQTTCSDWGGCTCVYDACCRHYLC